MDSGYSYMSFDKVINIDKVVSLFYMEFSKDFKYEGEKHPFWEMVYVDKGEMVCTANDKMFTIKSGEISFHKPNEYHNHAGNSETGANANIISFCCKSRIMKYFENKIFYLTPSERSLLSKIFEEGLSCFKLTNENDPLAPSLQKIKPAPFGSSHLTKNYLEIFLIELFRKTDTITKETRKKYVVDGIEVGADVKEILTFLDNNIYGRITLADITNAIGKSESVIKQIFKKYHAGGIIKYYNQLKIKEAKRLIREDKYNMGQISNMLCFDNPQYFCKSFKAVTQMTPSEYKKSINR